jgi:UDP-N-acetylglucosamine 2-epimerase
MLFTKEGIMKRILVPIGCRSDEGLSAPVIKRLREHFDVVLLDLIPQQFGASYSLTEAMLHETRPDLILITGDRVEMCAAAAAAFHNKVKIAHFYAGIINDPITTFDDVDRHCITLWSDIQFCESEEAHRQTCYLMASAGLYKKLNSHVVGISHLDDLEVDESKVPQEWYGWDYDDPGEIEDRDYDLILYNTPTVGDCERDINTIKELIEDSYSVLVSGNPDGKAESRIAEMVDEFHVDLPRPQFLGLLKNCQRFITNSSSAIYEAPHFLKPEQIIMVGDRNKNRPDGPFKTGASDRIVEILREYLK